MSLFVWDMEDLSLFWNLSASAVEQMPTLEQLVERLKREEQTIMQRMRGWHNYSSMGMSMFSFDMGVDSPHRAFLNTAPDRYFLVNRLNSKRYSLKPNLNRHFYLYRGQNKAYETIAPSYKHNELPLLIHNLKVEEFRMLLDSHPLVKLFNNGIILEGHKKPFFFEMNYYGLAQHYNFCTSLVDFTSDIEVAAFFAATKNLGDDRYVPITDTKEYPYGILYLYELNPFTTFTIEGFSSIGLQVFPRSGAQKGFLKDEKGIDINHGRVRKMLFRHDADVSWRYYLKNGRGSKLFPDDELAPLAKEIRDSKKISLEALARNSYWNSSEDVMKNVDLCREHGFEIDSSLRYIFLPEDLHPFYENIKNGLWEQFCNQLFFEKDRGDSLREKLLALPTSSGYSHYFNKRYLEQLNYHRYSERRNSLRNLGKAVRHV